MFENVYLPFRENYFAWSPLTSGRTNSFVGPERAASPQKAKPTAVNTSLTCDSFLIFFLCLKINFFNSSLQLNKGKKQERKT